MSARDDDATPTGDEPPPTPPRRRRRRHHHRSQPKPLFRTQHFRWWHILLAVAVGVMGALALVSSM